MTSLTRTKAKASCCGVYIRRKRAMEIESIPENPSLKKGIAVIYVGSGYKNITASASGNTYHFSDHHRHFSIAEEDVDQIMKNKDIIYKP